MSSLALELFQKLGSYSGDPAGEIASLAYQIRAADPTYTPDECVSLAEAVYRAMFLLDDARFTTLDYIYAIMWLDEAATETHEVSKLYTAPKPEAEQDALVDFLPVIASSHRHLFDLDDRVDEWFGSREELLEKII